MLRKSECRKGVPEEPRIDKPADTAKLASNIKPTVNEKPASTKPANDHTEDTCAGIFGLCFLALLAAIIYTLCINTCALHDFRGQIHAQTKIIVREAGTVTSWIATAPTQTNIVTLHKTTVVSITAITQNVPRNTQTYTIRSPGLYRVVNAEVYAL
ncbi:hypothetical protein E4T38_02480 [Aureobasidium subglaciale]|nr:hypothetical protein E4T38_02480 [Aureobasidium subglaciale]KAI5228147.1 hypothetical protein E4T40_02259 [Aureobasidium subglaciale]KAI5231373.1 hypothetical protein E4T41_02479 [Aureobasidium subglaciale]KAI5265557.1 hypothetical protein E4T46_02257 [Aureobasidium subglaciale]